MRRLLFLTVMLAFASTAGAQGVAGNWSLTMKSPMGGDETFTLAIADSGGDLTITCSDHPALQNLEGTGTLQGDAITMNLKATGNMPVEFAFTGTVNGDTITGTREISMSQGGAPGGAPPGGGDGAAPPGGGDGAAPPGGGEGGAPPGGGEGAAPPGGGEGGPPAGDAPGGEVSNAFTAKKI